MNTEQELLGQSKNGMSVYFDPIHSHVATHFKDTPHLKGLVQEIIADKDLSGDSMQFDTDMGRIVGESDLVENGKGDEIVYAKRMNRTVYTSFNKSQPPQPCTTVALSVVRGDDATYRLESAWIGSIECPAFPGEPDESADSKSFWTTHSLVWGRQKVQPSTVTSQCPW